MPQSNVAVLPKHFIPFIYNVSLFMILILFLIFKGYRAFNVLLLQFYIVFCNKMLLYPKSKITIKPSNDN